MLLYVSQGFLRIFDLSANPANPAVGFTAH